MVIDYSERKPVNKNRSKKQPVKLITLFITTVVLAIYSMGVVSGWFLFKTLKRNPANAPVPAAAEAKQKKTDNHSAGKPQEHATVNAKNNEPPLTFYQTLPKGEIVTLGTGMNPSIKNKTGNAPGALQKTAGSRPRPPVEQANEHPQKRTPGENSSIAALTESDSHKQGNHIDKKNGSVSETNDKTSAFDGGEKTKKKFTVQVASCNVRKDADEIKTSLDRKGLPAYVVESKVPGKGTRYRVRLGSGLDIETAGKIAAKAGSGAIVIPE